MTDTIMIAGPHAIGKSTTATALSAALDYGMVGSIAGPLAKRLRFDLNENPKPVDIAKYQLELEKAFELVLIATDSMKTVYDRSPLDLAAYTTLGLRDNPELDDFLKSYVDTCIHMTSRYCDVLILPEADLEAPYEDKGNRPKFDEDQAQYRTDYAGLIDYYVERLAATVKVIRIPAIKQYGARVDFVLEQLHYES
jgi:hypothetical protein